MCRKFIFENMKLKMALYEDCTASLYIFGSNFVLLTFISLKQASTMRGKLGIKHLKTIATLKDIVILLFHIFNACKCCCMFLIGKNNHGNLGQM